MAAEVTIIEMLPNAAPLEDEEVSKELERHLRKLGIKVLTNTKVESITKTGDGVDVKAGGQTYQGRQGADRDRLCAEQRRHWAGSGGREDRARRDRGGQSLSHERARTFTPSAM